MRYPKLKEDKSSRDSTLTLREFDYGINKEAGKWASEDCVLEDCVNMDYEADTLKTRKGFSAVENSLIEPEDWDSEVYIPFTITPTVYYKNSKAYNLAYCCNGDDTEARLRFYLVDSSGNKQSAGRINFHRITYNEFYIPDNVFFLVTDGIDGIGVFAFISRWSYGTHSCVVYEANENFSSWTNTQGSFYVPTVLINGRGERYDAAHTLGDFNYPEPVHTEELNLLTGKYKCYFTTDGLSSYFRLPYGNLLQYGTFSCRLYLSADTYVQWNISGDYTSNTQTVYDQQITLFLDRTLGLLRFCTPTDDYHVPLISGCKLNNIMVTATTTDNICPDAVISSKGLVSLNNRIYLFGNSEKKNCIYSAKLSNPFYFTDSAKLYIGDGASAVTSLKVQNGKLIAFKPGETYRVTTSFNDESTKKLAVLPENIFYIKSDTLGAQTIDTNIGCPYPKTLRLCGSRLVWLAADGNVYALATTTYGNTTNIYKVSQPLGDSLAQKLTGARKVFAVTDGGKYILVIDDTAFVMNFRVRGFGYSRTYYSKDDTLKSPAWFVWKLPEACAIYGGEDVDSCAVFYSSLSPITYYTSIISGDTDNSVIYEDYEYKNCSSPIESGFLTKYFDFSRPDLYKRLDCVFINGGSNSDTTLTLSDGDNNYNKTVKLNKTVRLLAGMPACEGVSVKLSSKRPFWVRNIALKHKLLSDKG
ncbi:MAG: hypothetical protein IKN39_00960 [Clostridia bacterium]|nr:hypothetical protein [Clostridia bacterium]